MKRLFYIFTFLFVALSAMAADITGGTILYLKPNSNWTQANARFAAYFCNGSSAATWVDMVKVEEGVYAVKVPSWQTHKNVIFCRMKPSTSNDWSNKWDQTGDLEWDGKNSLFSVIGWDGGTWSTKTTTWTMVGSSTQLFGGTNGWETNENNDLKLESGKYTKTYSNVYLSAGNIEYKVYGDNSSGLAFPDKNATLPIPGTGYYTVTFTFDASTKVLSASFTKNTFEVSEGGVYVFLKPNSNWTQANARFAMHYFIGDDKRWVDMVKLESHKDQGVIYGALLPEGTWEGFIFCRMNPSQSTLGNNWDNKWNQTYDLIYENGNNCYTIADGAWDKGEDIWSVLEPETTTVVEDLAEGAYYGTMKYKLTIPTTEFKRWHWISLPYDVEISNITSNKTQNEPYNEDFIMKRYDTEYRANWEGKSAPKDDKTWVMLNADEKLNAGQGYILSVDYDKIDGDYEITFKSSSTLHIVGGEFDREYTDYTDTHKHKENANWYLIGTGLYSTANGFSGVEYVAMPTENGSDYSYYFLSNATENGIFKNKLESVNPYTAFFIQYGGDKGSFKKAPRRAKEEEVVDRYYVNIAGAADSSYTAIFLAEDGSDDYVVGKDFLHLGASGASLQLYTLQGESTLSFNYLKREDRTVLVGGYVAQSGKYTISLDGNGDASSVLLYDATTGLVADLLNENYEFEAEKGILDGRFSVIISYAAGDGPTTMIGDNENVSVVVSNYDGIAHFEGLLVGESVVVYDVMGRCVTQFVAENDKADVMLTSGVYMLYHNGETVKFVVNR